jgi:hypothetical protein
MLFDILKIKTILNDKKIAYPIGVIPLSQQTNSNVLVCDKAIAIEILKSEKFQVFNYADNKNFKESSENFAKNLISHFSRTPLLLNGMKHIDARKKVLKLYELINADIDSWLEEFANNYINNLSQSIDDPLIWVDDFIQLIFKKIIANQLNLSPDEIPALPGGLLNETVPHKKIMGPVDARLKILNDFIEARYFHMNKDPEEAWALVSVPVMGYEVLLGSLIYGLRNPPKKNHDWNEHDLLREASALSLLSRVAIEDVELLNFKFHKNQIIFISPFIVNLNSDFEEKNSLEFGYGKKLCPGKKLSLKITNKFLKNLYKLAEIKFEFDNTYPERKFILKYKSKSIQGIST